MKKPASASLSAFERTGRLTEEVYARNGIDITSLPRDRTIRKLTQEEWIKSEEDASREFQILVGKAASMK